MERTERSFMKNGKERKERDILLKRTDAQPWYGQDKSAYSTFRGTVCQIADNAAILLKVMERKKVADKIGEYVYQMQSMQRKSSRTILVCKLNRKSRKFGTNSRSGVTIFQFGNDLLIFKVFDASKLFKPYFNSKIKYTLSEK